MSRRHYGQQTFHTFLEQFTSSFRSKPTHKQLNQNIKSVASIQNNARTLLKALCRCESERVSLIHLEKLVYYMKLNPLARHQVYRDDGIRQLLILKNKTRCKETLKQTRMGLAMLGHVGEVKERGIRILSLDGGGTRGVMTIEMLSKISELCNQPIHELFDLIVGTSTGAILAFLIGINKASLPRCKQMYDMLSQDIFQANRIMGTGKLFLNHAYYDASTLENIFKKELGEDLVLIDTAQYTGPKVIAISSAVNQTVLQAYLFRNYSLRPDQKSTTYMGSSKHKLWEAVRASTAAPGYFEEYLIDGIVHQDGGLLTNNPCALAIHEAKKLWPTTPIQTVVSIGTGVYHGRTSPHTAEFTSLREKLMKLVASATDVEAIHTILSDLLPSTDYIRLNPNMSIDVSLDESRDEYLRQLEQDTRNYIDKFSHKFDTVSTSLLKRKTFVNRCKEKLELKLKLHGVTS